MTLKNRISPSGPLAEELLGPFPGANLLVTATTAYLAVGELAASTTESDGQAGIPETGRLTKFTSQNVVAGAAPSFAITYNVRKNGVLIPGKTVATTNVATDPVEIDLSDVDVLGPDVGQTQDLISVEVVTAAFGGGTSPVVRSSLLWQPGGSGLN